MYRVKTTHFDLVSFIQEPFTCYIRGFRDSGNLRDQWIHVWPLSLSFHQSVQGETLSESLRQTLTDIVLLRALWLMLQYQLVQRERERERERGREKRERESERESESERGEKKKIMKAHHLAF